MSNRSFESDHRQKANKIIMRRTLYAAGIGLIPIPIVDAAGILGVQVLMIRDIAKIYEIEFKEQIVKSLITALAGDAAAVGLFKFIPGLGSFFGGASVAAVGAATTYALGKVFTQHFSQGGTLLDFDPVMSREFFQKEFEKGKKVVSDLRTKAGMGKKQESERKVYKSSDSNREIREQNKALHAEILALQQLQEILDKAGENFRLAVPDSWPGQATMAIKGDTEGLTSIQDVQ